MSLLDTIKAAREEVEEAGTLPVRKEKPAVKESEQEAEGSSTGFSRRSTARAKPTREAAGSVRVQSKPTSEMSKEEKKAAKQSRREEEDLLIDAKKVVLEQQEEYRQTQRVWWILLGIGLAASICSYLIMRYLQASGAQSGMLAGVSAALMVAAYVLIIGAFIYDLRKVRPLRQKADNKILGMSKRKLRKVIDEDAERKRLEKEEKAKAKKK